MKIYDPPPSSFDASPVFTGTVTFPDGSTWTSSGVTMAAGKTAALLVTTATSLALGGATIGTNALAVTGAAAVSGGISVNGATLGGDKFSVIGSATFSSTVNAIGGLFVGTAAQIIQATVSLTNGAGAGAGTLLTAPTAGNPSKWIGINDNGTIRYVPAW